MRSARTTNRKAKQGNGFFGDLFKSKTTYSAGNTKKALSAAYAAGKDKGDTGEFEIWWQRYSGKTGVNKKKAESEFRRGVEGEPSTKAVVAKKAVGIRGKHRGCNIYFDPVEKEYYTSCDRESKFESRKEAVEHINYVKDKLKKNPNPAKEAKEGQYTAVAYLDGKLVAKKVANTEESAAAKAFKAAKPYTDEIVVYKRQNGSDAWVNMYGRAGLDELASKVRKGQINPGVKEITEGFHGRESDEETEVLEEESYSDELAGLGILMELVICDSEDTEKGVPIKFNHTKANDMVMVACDEDGTIELIGGDQDLDIDKLEERLGQLKDDNGKPHNKVTLGYVYSICYWADKHHLEGPKYQAKGAPYEHMFAEDGGEMPMIVYDFRNCKIELVGGSYTITDEGIRN